MSRFPWYMRAIIVVLVVRIGAVELAHDVSSGGSWWLAFDVLLLVLAAAIVVDLVVELVGAIQYRRERRRLRREFLKVAERPRPPMVVDEAELRRA